ncbi:rRNA maturation RNase YbeY [Blochmannia endosymbiont of Camponotus modoc]|uniref:rRNA maturation RNase YbeY n=1 Tax=Blochmannia endosymbiont of Camponotus modoc TaxID=2945587 RepID=UPI00202563C0|nr:rRNA maturation RNase YbeY [Blochmannia endosymbiont of Camponotus modoc]URJ32062.1 rRNA maturation RNase YbeY [Blochmannia endosymbiont of Camponotus modoc]
MTNNQVIINLQLACKNLRGLPNRKMFQSWVSAIFSVYKKKIELTVRIVDIKEMRYLNWYYLKKDCPTNVLSFPFTPPLGIKSLLLGDVVLCRQVIEYESKEKNVPGKSHWAHMIIHGSLHLLGYNHNVDKEAILMQRVERNILQQCGYRTCCHVAHR